MRKSAMTLAVMTVLAAAGCAKLGGEKAVDLKFDKQITGEITSTSGTNYNDGSHRSLYQIKLDEKQAVNLQLKGALSGHLAAFHNGVLVAASSESSSDESSSDASGAHLAFRANAAGVYLVAVSGRDAKSFGPYRLEAHEIQPYDGKPLTAGKDIIDWQVSKSQDYVFEVDKRGLYQIDLSSDAYDTVLAMKGKDVEVEDDDGGDRLNSRIKRFLEPGQYTLTTKSVGDEGSGAFNLAVKYTELPNGLVTRNGTSLPMPGTVVGMLERGHSRSFVLSLQQATMLRLDVRSDDFDSVVHVRGQGASFDDDDGGEQMNSRLTMKLQPGRYTVEVESVGSGDGMFEVETRSEDESDAAAEATADEADAAEEAAGAAAAVEID